MEGFTFKLKMVLELRTDNQTIINDVNFEYSIFLDSINKAVISITGNTSFQRNLLSVGKFISIYRDGVLDFRGKINSIGNIEGNSIKLIVRGEEEEYVKDKCDISSLGTAGVWKSTYSYYIFEAILDSGVNYSAGIIKVGSLIDFKVSNSDSKWNAINNLLNKVGQEKFVDYVNQKINILNNVGGVVVDIINEGTDFDVLYFQESEAPAKKVIVYGKGDGDNQISATATSVGYNAGSDNTITITDSTIISKSEAQLRANTELAALEQIIKVYTIPIKNSFKPYSIGDNLTLNAASYGITSDNVRIVKISRGRKGKNDFCNIEVTNTEYSRTVKSTKQKIMQQASENRNKQTYMQGSGNTLTFGPGALNCNSSAPLRLNFNLPNNFITDEAGNIRVNSFTIDYDVDPFRSGIGSAELSEDADIDGTTVDDSPAVIGETASESLWSLIDTDTDSFTTTTSFVQRLSTSTFDTDDYYMIMVELTVTCTSTHSADETLEWEIEVDSAQKIVDFKTDFADTSYNSAFKISYMIRSTNSGDGDLDISFKGSTAQTISASMRVYGISGSHTHAAGTGLDADDHGHTAGTPSTGIYLDASSFNSDFSIGDDVSDAASVNATSVNLYLDFWNGSAWVNKHSILTTGKTVDTAVDISNGGTYPDASGLWSIRILPNSANGDLVIGAINIKHSLDN